MTTTDEKTPVVQLLREILNSHYAQTGLATMAPEDLANLAEEIMAEDYTEQEHAAMLLWCATEPCRAGPVLA